MKDLPVGKNDKREKRHRHLKEMVDEGGKG